MLSTKWMGALLLTAAVAQADVVADFGGEFQANTPATGWSYLWNSGGALKDVAYVPQIANFTALVYDTTGVGGYQTVNNGAWPDANPGAYTRVTGTQVFPGQTATQDAGGIQRYVILAYQFSAADLVAGNDLLFHTYNFGVPANISGLVDVHVFKNTQLVFSSDFVGGFQTPGFSDAVFGGDYSFGTVQANDTLYIALGTNGDYQGQPLDVSYTLAIVPEPGLLGLAALAPLLLRRRRA